MNVLRTILLVAALAPWGASFATAQTPPATKEKNDKKEKKASSTKKVAPASPIDLNTASQSELESIPGVGAATAKKIMGSRPYSSPSDLAKAGISPKTIQEISPMVKVSAASRAMPAPAPRAMPVPAARTMPAPAARTMPAPAAPAANAPYNGPAQRPPSPGMVWVNKDTKVYHRAGDRWYGKTKKGEFMSEQDAQKGGYRISKEK